MKFGEGCDPIGDCWMYITERLPVETFHLLPSKSAADTLNANCADEKTS